MVLGAGASSSSFLGGNGEHGGVDFLKHPGDAELVDAHIELVGFLANSIVQALWDPYGDHPERLGRIAVGQITGSQDGQHFQNLRVRLGRFVVAEFFGGGKDAVSDPVDAEGFAVEGRPGGGYAEEFGGDLLYPMATVFEFRRSAYFVAKFFGNGIKHNHIGGEFLSACERSCVRHSVACCLAHKNYLPGTSRCDGCEWQGQFVLRVTEPSPTVRGDRSST